MGDTPRDRATAESIVGLIDDLTTPIINLTHAGNPQHDIEQLWNNKLGWRLEELINYLGEKEWLLGYLTWADFKFAEFIEYIRGIWSQNYEFYREVL